MTRTSGATAASLFLVKLVNSHKPFGLWQELKESQSLFGSSLSRALNHHLSGSQILHLVSETALLHVTSSPHIFCDQHVENNLEGTSTHTYAALYFQIMLLKIRTLITNRRADYVPAPSVS